MWEIDAEFGASQYRQFRDQFLGYRLGLPGIREYPSTSLGLGDVDSGPIVIGIGGAASITSIKTALRYQDYELALALYQGVSACLFPSTDANDKRYLLGKLPILDAFMGWVSADMCHTQGVNLPNWRWKCQLISGLTGLLWIIFLYWQRKNN